MGYNEMSVKLPCRIFRRINTRITRIRLNNRQVNVSDITLTDSESVELHDSLDFCVCFILDWQFLHRFGWMLSRTFAHTKLHRFRYWIKLFHFISSDHVLFLTLSVSTVYFSPSSLLLLPVQFEKENSQSAISDDQ